MNLQEKVFNALSAALNVPVVKYGNEYDDEYPVVVYRETANEPALFGDDFEILRRITYQINIGTVDDRYGDLADSVIGTMNEIGFMHAGSGSIVENGVYWREIKFSKIIGGG